MSIKDFWPGKEVSLDEKQERSLFWCNLLVLKLIQFLRVQDVCHERGAKVKNQKKIGCRNI
jgi:hypothetical protein